MFQNDFDILLAFYIYNGLYKMDFATAVLTMNETYNSDVINVLSRYGREEIRECLHDMQEGIDKARRELGEI